MSARRFMTAVAALGLAGTAALISAPSASAHGVGQHIRHGEPQPRRRAGQGRQRVRPQLERLRHRRQRGAGRAKAKPSTAVEVLADGKAPVTAFLPTDRAFRQLRPGPHRDLYRSEKKVFAVVASLGIDTVEAVLLYHVVPGATITYKQALRANGAALTMASGGTVTVEVRWRTVHQAGGRRHRRRRSVRGPGQHQQGEQADRPRHHRVLRPINL